jgi:hypothetical protein
MFREETTPPVGTNQYTKQGSNNITTRGTRRDYTVARLKAKDAIGIEHGVNTNGSDPLEYVLALNLYRRHLSPSQRADVTSKVPGYKLGDNQHINGGSVNLPTLILAHKFKVSEKLIREARKVREKGTDELIRAVEQDEIAVSYGLVTKV